MKRGFFITANNTNIGKTLVTAGLFLLARAHKIRVIPMKPIQSGQSEITDNWDNRESKKTTTKAKESIIKKTEIAVDLQNIFKIANINPPNEYLKEISPYCYDSPCSPHLAAQIDNLPYADINHIKYCSKELFKNYEFIIAEGAGGVLVPFDEIRKLYVVDIIKALDFEVILVAGNNLGTINATCLSIEALLTRNVKIAGFIFNDYNNTYKDNYISKNNPKIITKFTGVKYLGQIPYLKKVNKNTLLSAMSNLDITV